MAPRKTTKIPAEPKPEPLEPVIKAAKPAAKPRTKKAAAEPVAPAEATAAPEPAPAKPVRKPRAAAAKATPESPAAGTAPVVEAAAAPIALDAATLITEQALAVLRAIHGGRAVELLFADAEGNPPRTFEPRQLVFDVFAKDWYVWGWDRRYNAERHHLLANIAQVNDVEGVGRAAQGPYKEGTPANQIGGWLGGEAIHVKAVLLKQWIFAVRQAPAPFPEFKIEDLEEGKAQVSFVGTDLRAIARWVMQFGDGIQIQEPQRLADRIKQVGVTWGGKPAAAAAPAPAKPAQPRPEREHRSEHKTDHHRSEHRQEAKPEHREPRRAEEPRREPRHQRDEAPKPASKAGKIEIRIDRL